MYFITQHLALVVLVAASGLMLIWPEIQSLTGKQQALSPLEATQLINQKHAVIFDLRREQDFHLGHLPNSRHVPPDEIQARSEELSKFKSRPAILVTTGQDAGKPVQALKTLGFQDVFVLRGGVSAWLEASLPISKTSSEQS